MPDADIAERIRTWPLVRLTEAYPLVRDFLLNLNLPALDTAKPLDQAVAAVDSQWLEEFGLNAAELPDRLIYFLEAMAEAEPARRVASLTILGGRDKSGQAEAAECTIHAGEAVSIVGPTGSGKSRLLADIECLAQGDTPTGRRILLNGKAVSEEDRFRFEGRIIAELSQNMNFVMDLTVAEFLDMHARSRMADAVEALTERCFQQANKLAGERFSRQTKVTQLSGGQSRSLMIADCAYMSNSAIVLIDEIENAGVDRREALALLSRHGKLVLIATHDPLLALGAAKRLVIRNGGIFRALETSPTEKACLEELEQIDLILSRTRSRLRAGDRIAGPLGQH
ncbi:MAG: ATP-binding cassette domain-containing protein [Treponema sp.]|jgi:ABC-type lipoprotein export system ATPase subunit|nr:ATP-binding cassette domain-containing protein [Treponema sp.]